MGTQKSLLSPPGFSVAAVGPVRAFERAHPLALEMGRPFATKGPLAGHPLPLPVSTCSSEAVIPSSRCWALFPRSGLQLAPLPPAQLLLPPNQSTFQLVAQRLAWRQKEEGDVAGGRRKCFFRLFVVSFGSVSSSSPPPLPLCLYFWQYDAICPR